jgi:nicotinamide-nucleotide amidase
MVAGALAHAQARATLAVAVTGIAGPGGAVPGKPVGTVWLAWGRAGAVQAERLQLGGDRDDVRGATVAMALLRLAEAAEAAEAGNTDLRTP